ncbi:Uncharacterised protein [Halioglobus japonicus]|nr:Uncharacterised protein [Halioglobus japonicus]
MSSLKNIVCVLASQVLMGSFAYSADSLEAVQMQFSQRANGQLQQWSLVIGDDRVVTVDVNGQELSIFDAADGKLYTLDHAAHSYRISDSQSVRQAALRVQQGMSAIESRIAELPESQQSQIRQRLMASFPQRQEAKGDSKFVSSGKSGAFAGVDCQWFETVVDGIATGQICATAPDQLEGGATLHSMLTSISDMYAEMEKADLGGIALPIPENPMAPVARLGLIPVKMEQYGDGEAGAGPDVELLSISQQLINPAALQLPSGYTLQE